MRNRLWLAMIVSFGVHSLLFFLWRKPIAPKTDPPLAIELHERLPTKNKGSAKAQTSSGRRKKKDLRLQVQSLPMAPSYKTQNFTQIGDLALGDQEWGSGGGHFAELENLNQYQRVFQEIRGLLNYPGILAEHGISGTVNARLTFNADSHCDWNRSHIEGAHPYLKVYVLALIKKLCAFETIHRLHFKNGQFVDLSLAFQLTQFPESQIQQEARELITGNVLVFYRSWIHSDLEYKLGPLRGYWIAPVVSINFSWIFEHWEQWVEGKDPLREFK